jgi:hypothetical protein
LFLNTQADITKTCVTHLSFDTFNSGFSPTDEDFEARLQSNILCDYAPRNRGYHAHTSLSSTEEEKLMLDLLECEGKAMIVATRAADDRNATRSILWTGRIDNSLTQEAT